MLRLQRTIGNQAVARLIASSGGGAPLPPAVQPKLERAFRADFSAVRVHEGSDLGGIGALALTRGDDIHVPRGGWDPASPAGQELLSHELAHVVQQRERRALGGEPGLYVDPSLEREADEDARRAVRGEVVRGARTADSAPAAGPIQPKLGFEYELQVFVSKKHDAQKADDDASAYVDPGLAKTEKLFSGNDEAPYDIVIDHASGVSGLLAEGEHQSGEHFEEHVRLTEAERTEVHGPEHTRLGIAEPGAEGDTGRTHKGRAIERRKATGYTSILEIVTHPVEERLPEEEAVKPARAAAALADRISQRTENLTRRKKLTDVLPDARPDLYVGLNGRSSQTTSANTQATFGVRLGGVPKLMTTLAGNEAPDWMPMQSAAGTAGKVMKALRLLLKTQPNQFLNLEGLLSIVALYLHVGKDTSKPLDKNVVPLLLRHNAAFLHGSLSEEEWDLLASDQPRAGGKTVRKFLTDALLKTTERGPDERVFRVMGEKSWPAPVSAAASQPPCGQWVDGVLRGQGSQDIFKWFEELRQIGPEEVGQPRADEPDREQGVVFEQRHVAAGTIPPGQWPALAAQYWRMLRDVNGIEG